jgi:alanine-glyoxylate transaminase / serine-glyoxylate transaminase / serine-pyruvate transaminase
MGNKNKPLKLMIPGPVQPEDLVMEEMGSPVRPHYGTEFRDLYNDTLELLRPIFGTSSDVFVLVGSGSSAIDACIGSTLPGGSQIAIGINGFFGERLKAIADGYNLDIIPVTAEWGEPLRAEDFKSVLKRNPNIRAVALVHLETSTTIINPVEDIGQVTKKYGIPFIVDAVSSLGGLPIYMDEWGVDMVASASQKCLGAPPGLSTVAVGPRGWEAIDKNPKPGHGWYLDLKVWRYYSIEWADWHPFPITMASNNLAALNTSLKSLLSEGISQRMERYRSLALRLRRGLRRINMPPFTPDEIMAPVLTGAYGPPGVPTSEIIEYMSEVHRIKIAGGLGTALKNKIFRIGHMAPTITETDIDEIVEALSKFRVDWRQRILAAEL